MKTKITIKTELEIVLPSLPNFVRTANKDVVMPIGELADEQIAELGAQWTMALRMKATHKRKEKMLEINKKLGNI